MKTVLVDTNYFLRLLIKDNRLQYQKAYAFFKRGVQNKVELYSTVPVFFEIYWVISSFYKKDKESCIGILNKILNIDFVQFENKTVLSYAVLLFEKYNLDLEDCYNLAVFAKENFDDIATYDVKVRKVSKLL